MLLFFTLLFLLSHPSLHAQNPDPQRKSNRTPLFSTSPPPSWLDDDSSSALPAFALRKLNPYLPTLAGCFKSEKPYRFSAQLDAETEIQITIQQETVSGTGRATWIGTVEGEPDSLVILSLSGNSAAGTILIPGKATYRIENAIGPWHRVGKIDPQKPYDCQASVLNRNEFMEGDTSGKSSPPNSQAAPPPTPAPAGPPGPSVIDLLIIFTESAREGAGGETAIEALIDTTVAEVNVVLANSGIDARVNLVHAEEMNFVESGSAVDDLHELSDHDPDDAPNEAVHDIQEMRQKYRADVVCLIAENTGESLGIANLMTDLDIRFGRHAYCIIQRATAHSYFSLAHELGHLMGCQHDREHSYGPGLYPYSHAHRMTIDGVLYHTVMSYQPGLPIPYYSNPNVTFRGVPTGVPESETNSANNAATIMSSAPVVALFDRVLKPSQPPVAKLLSPLPGARFAAYETVQLVAEVGDPDGNVSEVEFYINGRKVWTCTNPPYSCLWTNSGPGAFAVRVEAEDDSGNEVYSPYVTLLFTNSAPRIDPAGCTMEPQATFSLKLIGNPGQDYLVEKSSDLIHWTAWSTNHFTNFVQWVHDSPSQPDLERKGSANTFYRISEWFPPSPY